MAATYSIQWHNCVSDIDDNLWHACFNQPLEGKWWYQSLESCGIEDQFIFAYALITEHDGTNSRAVGIAPTFVHNIPIDLVAPPAVAAIFIKLGAIMPSLRYQRTLFVGSPCAEEGTVGLLPGVQLAVVAPYLEKALEERARQFKAVMIAWKDFAECDRQALEQLCGSDDLFKVVSYPGTMVELPQGQFADYLKSLKASHRHNLTKKLKRSKQQGELEVSVIQHPDVKTQEEIFALFWQTYEKGKTKFERLNPEFFRQMADLDLSWYVLLRSPESGKLVAFMLCFRFDNRVVNKFIGIDYAQGAEWYMYPRLWEAAVNFVMSLGVSEFQSGQTGYRAKLDLGNQLVPLTSYCKHVNPLIRRIYAHLAADICWSTLDDDLKVYISAHPEAEILPAKQEKTVAAVH